MCICKKMEAIFFSRVPIRKEKAFFFFFEREKELRQPGISVTSLHVRGKNVINLAEEEERKRKEEVI